MEDKDNRIKVLLPLPIGGALDYLAFGDNLVPGKFVEVPLTGRRVKGVVWDENSGHSRVVPLEKLKAVESVLDLPPITADHRAFIDWVSAYTLSAPGAVLKMSMNVKEALKPPPVKRVYKLSSKRPARMTAARERILEVAGQAAGPLTLAQLASKAATSVSTVRKLASEDVLSGQDQVRDRPYPEPDPNAPGPQLSEEQVRAAAGLVKLVKRHNFKTALLEGVTGSGKTEVYFEAIAAALKDPAAQVLVLLPEIALTSQWLGRFQERFGVHPVQWHSDLGAGERRRAWRAVLEGKARVVVGARSALFLPFRNLKLLVVDEEHDASFKQEEGVIYSARDMAVVRASLGNFPAILVSATPSYESLVNAEDGKYLHFILKERHGPAEMPTIKAIDLRQHPPPPGRWISELLENAIGENLIRGEQTMLFLNRRGFAPLTLCRACGERMDCPNCSAWLVEHRYKGELMCHHCGFVMPFPNICKSCGAEGKLAPCGPGVERLSDEVATLFPEARVLIMTSDTVTGPAKARDMVAGIEDGLVDIVIGTQIITKGYHFPNLTLVGVVDADLGLQGADLRAGERTYQQLEQVSGRAGRAERPGVVYLQTFSPDHPVTASLVSGDRATFLKHELNARRRQQVPPFGRMAALIITGRDIEKVTLACRQLAKAAPASRDFRILGPAPAPLARLRGHYRYRFLMLSDKNQAPQKAIREWLARAKPLKAVRIKIDIDPISFT